MDAQNNARSNDAFEKCFPNAHVRRLLTSRYGIITASALAVILKDVAGNDISSQISVLRQWGIR